MSERKAFNLQHEDAMNWILGFGNELTGTRVTTHFPVEAASKKAAILFLVCCCSVRMFFSRTCSSTKSCQAVRHLRSKLPRYSDTASKFCLKFDKMFVWIKQFELHVNQQFAKTYLFASLSFSSCSHASRVKRLSLTKDFHALKDFNKHFQSLIAFAFPNCILRVMMTSNHAEKQRCFSFRLPVSWRNSSSCIFCMSLWRRCSASMRTAASFASRSRRSVSLSALCHSSSSSRSRLALNDVTKNNNNNGITTIFATAH